MSSTLNPEPPKIFSYNAGPQSQCFNQGELTNVYRSFKRENPGYLPLQPIDTDQIVIHYFCPVYPCYISWGSAWPVLIMKQNTGIELEPRWQDIMSTSNLQGLKVYQRHSAQIPVSWLYKDQMLSVLYDVFLYGHIMVVSFFLIGLKIFK